MRTKMLCKWAVVVAFLGALVWLSFVLPPSISPFEPQAETSGGRSATNESIQDIAAEAVAQYTKMVAWFTFVLAISTMGLWWATWKSARTAERALTELEQPVIVPEIKTPGLKIEDTAQLRYTFGVLQYVFANYGRTPAFLLELAENLHVPPEKGNLPKPLNPNDNSGQKMPWGIVAPAGSASMEFGRNILGLTLGESATANGLQELIAGGEKARELGVFWHGYVRYGDIFGREYVRGFCFLYHRTWDRWIPAGGDAFNYLKMDKSNG